MTKDLRILVSLLGAEMHRMAQVMSEEIGQEVSCRLTVSDAKSDVERGARYALLVVALDNDTLCEIHGNSAGDISLEFEAWCIGRKLDLTRFWEGKSAFDAAIADVTLRNFPVPVEQAEFVGVRPPRSGKWDVAFRKTLGT